MHLQRANGWLSARVVCVTYAEVEAAMQAKRDNPDLPYTVINYEGEHGRLWGSWIWNGEKWG